MNSGNSHEDIERGYNNSVELAHRNCEPKYAELDFHSETESVSEEFLEWFHSSRRNRGDLQSTSVSQRIKIELDKMTNQLEVGKATNDLITNAGDLVKRECNAESHDLNPIRVEWNEGNPPTVTMDLENYEGPLPGENPQRSCSPLMDDYRTIKRRLVIATGIYIVIVGFGVTAICLGFVKGLW